MFRIGGQAGASDEAPGVGAPPRGRGRLASFLVPPLTVLALIYHVLASLQITVSRGETILVVAVALGMACVLGLAAAFGGSWVRTTVLSVVAVCWLDMALPLPTYFDPLAPATDAAAARDARRIADIETIRLALETHITEYGALPRPQAYGEGVGPVDFWERWWDLSADDENDDGRPFLEFLVDRGLLLSVPVDPENIPSTDGHPGGGRQYIYFVTPADYVYEGGSCEANAGYSTYMLAVTEFETDEARSDSPGTGCECLWRDKPDFFRQHFDFRVCGRFQP